MLIECDPEKIRDVVIILDFQMLSILDLVKVEKFILSILAKLPVSNDNTRVAIVTKKGQPVAGWYLNSARPGYTLSDALKVNRTYIIFRFNSHLLILLSCVRTFTNQKKITYFMH